MTVDLMLGDSLELMKSLPDGSVDAVVTDPNYGIGLKTNYRDSRAESQNRDTRSHAWASKNHPSIGDGDSFDPAPLLRFKKLALWGANNYADKLPPQYSWLVWDKRDGRGAQNGFGDCELCYFRGADFHSVRLFSHLWIGYQRDSEVGEGSLHPTQKPVPLMEWCVLHLTDVGHTVLDPFMGSGTTGIACVKLGRNFIGMEINPDYFAIAQKRISEAQLQMRLL